MTKPLVEPTPEDIERIKYACLHHTPNQPTGYVAWHNWAMRMSKTHKQIKCEGCGLYQVWVPKSSGGREMKIGDLRRSLFMDYDCRWNSVVRDVTAKHEKHEEETPELEVMKVLLDHLTMQARLDITFPQTKGSRIQTLFTEDAV